MSKASVPLLVLGLLLLVGGAALAIFSGALILQILGGILFIAGIATFATAAARSRRP